MCEVYRLLSDCLNNSNTYICTCDSLYLVRTSHVTVFIIQERKRLISELIYLVIPHLQMFKYVCKYSYSYETETSIESHNSPFKN